MIPLTKNRCMNGYTSRIGIIDTMATVYLMTRVLSMFAAACVDMPPEPLTSADRFEDWFRYTYRRCCRVYSSGREDIRSSESWNEFQLPTAPKIEIVARIGTDSGRIIFRNTVGVFWGIFNYASSMVYNTDKHLGEGKMMYARVPDEANPIVYGLSTLGGNRIWSVGSKAAYPELCLAILDFFATPEGSMTMWYGPRGLMWDYDENGGMYFTELGDICNKDTKHDLNGVVWTSPYTGKQYTLSGNFNDGCIQANNTTYSKDAINPDGKLGETFNRDTWVSILNAVSYPIQEDWRNWSGAVLADPYFESIGKYTIMPDLPYSESVKDDELKVKWEQCAKSIKNNSWLAIYAKADGEFNMHIRNMITQCNNYGYADCLEWSKGEAATKWRLTQELNAVGQE